MTLELIDLLIKTCQQIGLKCGTRIMQMLMQLSLALYAVLDFALELGLQLGEHFLKLGVDNHTHYFS